MGVPRPDPGQLAAAMLVVLGLWVPAALDPEGSWADLLDNAHWTFS